MQSGAATPFYLDWTFWAVVASAIAVVLSQLPPVKTWFRGPRILVETPAQLRITHAAGYPAMGIVLGLRNVGGRSARVTSMKFKITRDKRDQLEVPITEFYPAPGSSQALVLVPFTLAAGAEVMRSVNAYLDLSREQNRQISQLASNVRRDVAAKLEARDAKGADQKKELVVADEKLVEEGLALYKKNFWWTSGEYDFSIEVATERECQVAQPKKQFTIWESDEADLRALTDEYKHGFGIGIGSEKQAGIFVKVRVV